MRKERPEGELAATLFLGCMAFVGISVVGFIALIAFASAQLEEDYKPRPLPPLYPNAQNVRQEVIIQDQETGQEVGVATFASPDEPAAIKQFYRDYMAKAGWSFWRNDTPEDLSTDMFGYAAPDGPRYIVMIATKPTNSGGTNVRIQMTAAWANWHGEELQVSKK